MPQMIFTSDKGDWPSKNLTQFLTWVSHMQNGIPERARKDATIELSAISDYETPHIAKIVISY